MGSKTLWLLFLFLCFATSAFSKPFPAKSVQDGIVSNNKHKEKIVYNLDTKTVGEEDYLDAYWPTMAASYKHYVTKPGRDLDIEESGDISDDSGDDVDESDESVDDFKGEPDEVIEEDDDPYGDVEDDNDNDMDNSSEGIDAGDEFVDEALDEDDVKGNNPSTESPEILDDDDNGDDVQEGPMEVDEEHHGIITDLKSKFTHAYKTPNKYPGSSELRKYHEKKTKVKSRKKSLTDFEDIENETSDLRNHKRKEKFSRHKERRTLSLDNNYLFDHEDTELSGSGDEENGSVEGSVVNYDRPVVSSSEDFFFDNQQASGKVPDIDFENH